MVTKCKQIDLVVMFCFFFSIPAFNYLLYLALSFRRRGGIALVITYYFVRKPESVMERSQGLIVALMCKRFVYFSILSVTWV